MDDTDHLREAMYAMTEQITDLKAERNELRDQVESLKGIITTNGMRNQQLLAEVEALRYILSDGLRDAEWCDKRIHPYRGEPFQNWKLAIYLPVPLDAGWTPEQALDEAVKTAIAAKATK